MNIKLLLDQDVYAVTAKCLIEAGYDVLTVAQLDLSQASDEEVLNAAQTQNRILITRDRDYGNLIFVKGLGSGVIYLRMQPNNLTLVHNELLRILEMYSESSLIGAFIVVEADRHRFRRPNS
jgi:predicted nuclease of predicted toxin-antitoxin system